MKKLIKKIRNNIDFTNRFGTVETAIGLAAIGITLFVLPAELIKLAGIFAVLALAGNMILVNRK